MASILLKQFLYPDIVNIITEYNLPDQKNIYEKNESVISALFLINDIHNKMRAIVPDFYAIRITQLNAFCYETNKYVRKNMFHYPQTHYPNFYKLDMLFKDSIFLKMLRLLKRYKSFNDIYKYENNEDYKYLLSYTKNITNNTKKKQNIYDRGKCIAINASNNKECSYKRKYEFYCGRHNKAENVFNIFKLIDY